MKKTMLRGALSALIIVGASAGAAFASPFGAGGGASLQGVFDSITTSPTPGTSNLDVTNDFLADSGDSYWSIGGSGGSIATLVIEIAGYAGVNTFGIFDASDPTKMVQLFGGSATTATRSVVSIFDDGSVEVNLADTLVDFAGNLFGYYLTSPEGTFYSDTALNSDGVDHMLAYQGGFGDTIKIGNLAPGVWGANEYALAFEDLLNGGDRDYTDMVIMVESVNPVPEPTTMLLFGAGLAGLAGVSRRKKG